MTSKTPDVSLPEASGLPIPTVSETVRPLAVRDEQGRFIGGNPGGPGRPAGRRDRINAALEALREHYGTDNQAAGIKAFVREVLAGLSDTRDRLELLRIILPRESSADLRVEQPARPCIIRIVDTTVPGPTTGLPVVEGTDAPAPSGPPAPAALPATVDAPRPTE